MGTRAERGAQALTEPQQLQCKWTQFPGLLPHTLLPAQLVPADSQAGSKVCLPAPQCRDSGACPGHTADARALIRNQASLAAKRYGQAGAVSSLDMSSWRAGHGNFISSKAGVPSKGPVSGPSFPRGAALGSRLNLVVLTLEETMVKSCPFSQCPDTPV